MRLFSWLQVIDISSDKAYQVMHHCYLFLWISIQKKWREKLAGKFGLTALNLDWNGEIALQNPLVTF